MAPATSEASILTDTLAVPAKTPDPGVFVLPRIRWPSGWTLFALAIVALVLAPVVVTFSSFARIEDDILRHLAEFVLPELIVNTLWLVAGVGLGVTLLGVSLAWLVAMCEFPGRRIFDWALLLPLALPAYVTAFVAIGLLDFTGPAQTWLRTGWGMPIFSPVWKGWLSRPPSRRRAFSSCGACSICAATSQRS